MDEVVADTLREGVSDWLHRECGARCGALCGYMCDCPGCPGSMDPDTEAGLVRFLEWRMSKALRKRVVH